MTCVAWDGKMLAADKQSMVGDLRRTVTKIQRIRGALVGCAGDFDQAQEMFAWIKGGCKVSQFPELQRDPDRWCAVLVVRPDGIYNYQRTPYPTRHEDKQTAIGSGRDFALAAMHLGKTAREAVEIASLFDPGCGGGVDTLKL